MYNVTHCMYLPNKRSSLLILHSRIPLIKCASEYSESLYSRIHIRIRHPVFAIRIVFVTWCICSSPSTYTHIKQLKCHTDKATNYANWVHHLEVHTYDIVRQFGARQVFGVLMFSVNDVREFLSIHRLLVNIHRDRLAVGSLF